MAQYPTLSDAQFAAEAARLEYNKRIARIAYIQARTNYVQELMRIRGIEYYHNLTIDRVVLTASIFARGSAAESVGIVAKTYKQLMKNKAHAFQKMFERVGQEATAGVAKEFAKTKVGGSSKGFRSDAPGQYRRDSGGKLAKALRSPNMYVATKDGLLFINRNWLDINARQWYRLNFGAGGAGSSGRRPGWKPVSFFGANAGHIGLTDYSVSKAFQMPQSFWLLGGADAGGNILGKDIRPPNASRRGRDDLIPIGYAKGKVGRQDFGLVKEALMSRRWTRGIKAQGFLDTGVSRIATLAPAGIETIYAQIARETLQDAGSASARIFNKNGVESSQLNAILEHSSKAMQSARTQAEARIRAERFLG